MKTTIKKVTKFFTFEEENGFEVTIEGFEDGLAVIEIPVEVDTVIDEGGIYVRAINEDEYVSFISGCFGEESNFKEELLRAYECSSDTEFLGFKLRVQEVSCTITEENSSIFKIRESLRLVLLTFAQKVIYEANREIYEHSEKIKRLNDILDHTELRFKSYRAEVEYEEHLEGKDIDEIGYGEDFATYVQYLVSQGCNISEAVQETYSLFESIGTIDDGDSQTIQFVCQYCLYGEEIVKGYFDILMQRFNDELKDL